MLSNWFNSEINKHLSSNFIDFNSYRKTLLCKFVLLFLLVLLPTRQGHADPVFGEIFDLRQPDGTTIKARVWGDEFYHVAESLDGYTLVRDPLSGEICYAELSPNGSEFFSTGISANRKLTDIERIKPHIRLNKEIVKSRVEIAKKKFTQRNFSSLSVSEVQEPKAPCIGDVKGICILVDFMDEPQTVSPEDINDLCNKAGYNRHGNNGSVYDYFYEVSGGLLKYTNDVFPIYYRAQHDREYYKTDPNFGEKAGELVVEALTWLDSRGFDFSEYDYDEDEEVDAVNIFYAGERFYLDDGLWPHQGWINFYADGVSISRYQISDISYSPEIGTFCHENGHLICWWPDLYDYGRIGSMYESAGIGYYCLMSSASTTNPIQPCAYLKDLAGWANIIPLETAQSNLLLEANTNTFYKFCHPYLSNEFYMISNRQKTGRDLDIPDSGLAIWHIDENANNNNQQMTPKLHYMVSLIQADGRWDLEKGLNWGDSNDLFDSDWINQCTPFTNPATNWWEGNSSTMSITNISSSDDMMWFDFSIEPSPPVSVDANLVILAGEPTVVKLKGLDDYLPDPPGQITYIITKLPDHGTMEDPNAGIITTNNTQLVNFGNAVMYRSQDGYLGLDYFSFETNDGGSLPTGGYSNEATISITVSTPIYVDDDAENDPYPGNPNSSDPIEDGSAEHPFDAIQKAIDSATSTETIIILSGTYTGTKNRNIDFKGKPITVRSEGDPNTCIIDCQGLGRGFYFHSGEGADSVLEGITIINGYTNDLGGGIYCENNSGPTIINCIFTKNSSNNYGGGLFNYNSNPNITNCSFTENSANNFGSGMYNESSSPTVTNCMFAGNLSYGSGGGMTNSSGSIPIITNSKFINNSSFYFGGGMDNYNSNPIVTNCEFNNNHANTNGGGIYNYQSDPNLVHCIFNANSSEFGGGILNYTSNPTLTNCEFYDNEATVNSNWYDSCGGGIYNVSNSGPILTNCIFSNNSADWGGGLCNDNSSLTLTDCEFNYNTAIECGGGMYNENYSNPVILTGCIFTNNSSAWGGGLYNYNGSPIVTDCKFSYNKATDGGGGIENEENSNPVINDCRFNYNSATWGGGVRNYSQSFPTINNCTFTQNTAQNSGGAMQNYAGDTILTNCVFKDNSTQWGGGICIKQDCLIQMDNCTLVGNAVTMNGGGIYIDGGWGSSIVITNCILWANTGTTSEIVAHNEGTSVTINYCDIEGGLNGNGVRSWNGAPPAIDGGGNFNINPLFANLENGDYHLKSQAGRWDTISQSWVIDDVTSPCIDAGDPNSPVADEPEPNGGIINLGAYGGTTEASKSTTP